MIAPRGAGRQPQTFLRMAIAWVVRRQLRGRDPRLPFWSILSFLRRPYATLIVFVATGLLLVGMQLGVASLTRQGINSLVGYDLPAFLVAVAGMFLLLAAEAAGRAWWRASAVDCGAEIASQMRWHLADRLLAAPVHVVERLPPGELGARFTSDITAASALLRPTLSCVHTSFLALGAAVYMIVLDWRIGLATLVAAIVTTKTGEVLSRPISHAAARVQDSYAQLSAFSEQSLANVATVKVFNLEGLLQEGFARLNTAAAEVGRGWADAPRCSMPRCGGGRLFRCSSPWDTEATWCCGGRWIQGPCSPSCTSLTSPVPRWPSSAASSGRSGKLWEARRASCICWGLWMREGRGLRLFLPT